MSERDNMPPLPENYPAAPGGPAFPEVEPLDPPMPNFMLKSEIQTPPDSDEQVAAAGRGETQTPLDFLKEQLRQGGLLDEKDEQEKGEAPPVDNPEAVASSVEPSQPLPPEVAEEAHTYDPNMDPDRPPEDDSGLRIDPETGRIDPDSIGQVGADAAVGAGAVGEASGPGETIEDVARKAILDLPGATGDVVERMDDPAANAVYDGVETPPFMKDDLEGGLGDVGDEDVVESMDDPVVDQ
jgi:hypothetical protein